MFQKGSTINNSCNDTIKKNSNGTNRDLMTKALECFMIYVPLTIFQVKLGLGGKAHLTYVLLHGGRTSSVPYDLPRR